MTYQGTSRAYTPDRPRERRDLFDKVAAGDMSAHGSGIPERTKTSLPELRTRMVISPPRAAAYCFRSQRPVSVSHRACRIPALIYVFSISVVATILFVAVEDLEPNRCLALALKFLILFVTLWQWQED